MQNPSFAPRPSLTDNGDGTYTYDDGLGNQTLIADTITTMTDNGDGSFTYVSEDGTATTIPAPGSGTTSTLGETVNTDGTRTYTHDDGTGATQSLTTGVVINDEDARSATLDHTGVTLGRTLHVASPGHTTGTIDVSHADSDQTAISGVTTTHNRTVIGGTNLTATGANAIATGEGTTAAGAHSFAGGRNTAANGIESYASGRGAVANGAFSRSIGLNTNAVGGGSIATGNGSTTNGLFSLAGGVNTQTNAPNSIAWGNGTSTSGAGGSVALGVNTQASNANAVAIGNSTTASGDSAVAAGFNTTASGTNALAVGANLIAAGDSSAAFGSNNGTTGNNSEVHGQMMNVIADRTHVTGHSASTVTWGQINTFGLWNMDLAVGTTTPTESIHTTGNVLAGATFYPSDERLKDKMQPIETKGNMLKVQPKQFVWKPEHDPDQGQAHAGRTVWGFSAQELQQQFPACVRVEHARNQYDLEMGEDEQKMLKKGEPTDRLLIEPLAIIAVLWQTVQAQDARISALETPVKATASTKNKTA